ncbi:hypothetical protein LINPERHAP2_LOCUS30372 [Linum perenne]
MINTLLLMSI